MTPEIKPISGEVILIDIIPEAPDIKTFRFQTPDIFKYKSGQFVMLKYPKDSIHHQIGARAYSISSSPNSKNYFDLTIQKVGKFTTEIFNSKVNEKFTFTGPHGKFGLPEDKKEIVFLTGGSGITPFLSMIRDLDYNNKQDTNITIFYSCRTPDLFIRRHEIEEICKRNPNIKTHFTITRPRPEDKDWKGLTGRINKEMLEKHLHNLQNKTFFIVGTKDMIDTLKELLMKELNVPKEQIVIENWG